MKGRARQGWTLAGPGEGDRPLPMNEVSDGLPKSKDKEGEQ